MSGIAQSTSGGAGGGGSSGGNSGSGSSSTGQNSSGSQRTGSNQNSNGQQQRSGTNQNSNSSQQRTGTNQNSNTQQPQQGTNQNPGMSQPQSGTIQNSNAQQSQQGTNQNPNMSQQPTGINPNTTPLQPGVAPSPSVPQQQFSGTQNTNAQQQRNGTTPSQGVPQQPLGSNQPITGQRQLQQQPGMNQNTNTQQQRGLPQNPNVNQQSNLGNTASPLTPANQTGALGTSFSGNIGAFTGNGFSLVSSPNGTPTNFIFGTETLFLDSSGRNIPRERFTSETPATVYYTRSGDNMIASRVVANDPPPVFSAGTIREVSPGVLVVELPGASPTPVRYVDNKSTNYVDQNGDPVSPDSIKSGTIAKVFYTKVGDTLVASKVEVVRQDESSGLPKPPLPDASSDSTAKPEGTTKP